MLFDVQEGVQHRDVLQHSYYSGNTEKEKDAAHRKHTAVFYRDTDYSVAGRSIRRWLNCNTFSLLSQKKFLKVLLFYR